MTLSNILSSTPEGRRNLAAAQLRGDVLELLHDALESRDTTRTELAQLLGRSKAAISNALGGDGNLRVNTIAEYLDALDMELELRAVPREVREIEPPCVVTALESAEAPTATREEAFDPKTQRITASELTVGTITEFWDKAPQRESRTGSWAAPSGHASVNTCFVFTSVSAASTEAK